MAAALAVSLLLPAAQSLTPTIAAADSNGPQLGFSGTVAGAAVNAASLPAATTASKDASSAHDVARRVPSAAALASAKSAAGAAAAAVSRGNAAVSVLEENANPTVASASEAASTADGPSSDAPAVNGAGFYGNGECDAGSGCWVPSDMGMAKYGSYIVEANNDVIRIFNTSGVVVVGPFSLQAWFGRPAGDFVFDPVVNARAGKFVITAVDCPAGNCNNSLILVSGTGSNPTAVHCNYAFNGNTGVGAGNFADYPKQGMTSNRTLIATNTFTSGGAFVNNLVTILVTTSITPTSAGCPAAQAEQWFNFGKSGGGLAFTQVPAQDYDADGGNVFQIWSAHFGTSSGFDVWKRSATFNANNWTFYAMGTGGYSIPPNAPQPGTGLLMDSGDDRLQTAVKRYGQVWFTHTTGIGGCGGAFPVTANSHIVRALSTGNVAQAPVNNLEYYVIEGPNAGCGNWDIFPAGTPDGNGDFLYGFDRVGPGAGNYVHLRGSGFSQANGIGSSVLVKASTCACVDGSGRWGDYSSASLDNGNQDYVWVAAQLLQGNSFWTTGIGKILHKPPSI